MQERSGSGTRLFRYYVARSLDGFIADASGGVDWLEPFFDTDYGFRQFFASVDAAIAGRKTMDHTLKLSGGKGTGLRTYVLTRGSPDGLPAEATAVSDVKRLVAELRAATGGDIWVMGGGETARAMLVEGALDTIELHTMPVVLGSGTPLFGPFGTAVPFRLRESRTYPNGVVYSSYAAGS